MIDFKNYPEILKAHKVSKKLSEKNYALEIKLNKLKDKADCWNCIAYQSELQKPFEERFQECATWCKYKNKIKRVHADGISAFQDWDDYDRNEYARIIFDAFSEEKPKLVFQRTKEEVNWIDAFGTDFDKLDRGSKGSLSVLVEDSGGGYRFAEGVLKYPHLDDW